MADISQSILRKIKDAYDNPRLYLEQVTDNLKNYNHGRVAEVNDRGAGYRKLTDKERVAQMTQGVLDNVGGAGMGALGVIKSKGGNWLASDIAGAVSKLKRDVEGVQDIDPEMIAEHMAVAGVDLRPKAAINKWIDGALTRYLKNDMATPHDPVRALAEQGILHTKPDKLNFRPEAWGHSYGNPEQQWLAKSDLAKRWEGASDNSVSSTKARDFKLPEFTQFDTHNGQPVYGLPVKHPEIGVTVSRTGEEFPWVAQENTGRRVATGRDFDEVMREAQLDEMGSRGIVSKDQIRENPWLQKLPPDEPVYGIADRRNAAEDLGFDDLIDQLNAAMTRTDIPEHLRLTPEHLDQMGMDKAIRHIHAVNEFDTTQKLAVRMGMPVYKDFGDGYRWVELNKPGSFANESDIMGHSVRGYEPESWHPDYVTASGHDGMSDYGLGGWEAIKSGKAKILSLIDKKGEPHVTVEMSRRSPEQPLSIEQVFDQYPEIEEATSNYFYDALDSGMPSVEEMADRARKLFPDHRAFKTGIDKLRSEMAENYTDMPQAEFEALVQEVYGKERPTTSIHQIKGKQNLKPNDEYLPYVQDLIKSGEWLDVRDLSNAGLYKHPSGYLTQDELKPLVTQGDQEAMDIWQRNFVDETFNF